MKISEVQKYLDATITRFGDLECLIDVDPNDEDLYSLEGIFCDINPDDETDVSLVFALFEIKHKLMAVK